MIETYVFIVDFSNLSNTHEKWVEAIQNDNDKFIKEAVSQRGMYDLWTFQKKFNEGSINFESTKILFVHE